MFDFYFFKCCFLPPAPRPEGLPVQSERHGGERLQEPRPEEEHQQQVSATRTRTTSECNQNQNNK